jgi:hypothetical protein
MVFVPNLGELVALLDRAATDYALAMELVQNVRRPDVRDQFQQETVQRLHNHVAATKTLADHTLRIMRARCDDIATEFDVRKADLLANPEVTFIAQLRNFTLHYSLPLLAHQVEMKNVNTPQQEMRSEVQLNVGRLLEWEKWSAAERAFISAGGGGLELRPIVHKQGELVYRLNAWLADALTEANRAGLVEVDRLIVRRNAVVAGVDLPTAERLSQPPPPE